MNLTKHDYAIIVKLPKRRYKKHDTALPIINKSD